jgi:hypothetical protein
MEIILAALILVFPYRSRDILGMRNPIPHDSHRR